MSVPEPVLGPCSSWITSADVLDCCQEAVESSDDEAMMEERAVEASMLMYELSGRQFSGLCGPLTVRPCRSSCGCWGPLAASYAWTWGMADGWAWRDCTGDRCGCGTTSYVKLAGYPVREVSEVKIDGVVLDPSEYRLEGWRRLMRTTDPGPPVRTRAWPACQDLALEDTEPGTFSITYSHGIDPPPLGIAAAAELACELYAACRGGNCRLPSRVVSVARQGVTMQRIVPLAEYLRAGATGLTLVDSFIAAVNPDGMRRRPAVWSPDVQKFPRREAV